MRHLFFFLSLFLIQSVSAQELSGDVLMAIKNGETEKLSELIALEDLNTCYDVKGSSYNFLAISLKMDNLESLKYFAEKGADLEAACTGKTALMYAAKYGRLEAMKYLLNSGADLTAAYKDRTAADYAEKYDQAEISAFLKQYGK